MKSARLATAFSLFLLGASAFAVTGSGCSAGNSNLVETDNVGSARLAITNVPEDVSCIRIDAVGSNSVTTFVDVTPGQPADINLDAQPVGLVSFSAEAYPAICPVITNNTIPTWVSDPVIVTLTPGVPVNLSLVLYENGVVGIGVDFASATDCHEADQPCLSDSDCCSNVCYPNQVCAGACFDNGAACTGNAECCAGQCSDGACCVPDGNSCGTDADCCSGSCVAGSCQAAADGGAGSGACDNSGNCGDDQSGCTACALAGACAAANDACANGQDCLSFVDCVGSCQDQACFDGCAAVYPSGAASYNALITCVYCQECPVDCDPESLGVACP